MQEIQHPTSNWCLRVRCPTFNKVPTEIESIHVTFQSDAHFQSLKLTEFVIQVKFDRISVATVFAVQALTAIRV